jgi:hypothetical protein
MAKSFCRRRRLVRHFDLIFGGGLARHAVDFAQRRGGIEVPLGHGQAGGFIEVTAISDT